MKRFLFGLLWFVVLAFLGGALAAEFIPPGLLNGAIPPNAPPGAAAVIGPVLGAFFGAGAFFPLAGCNLLYGAAANPRDPVHWGIPQAIWMLVQFFAMQATAQILLVIVFVAVRLATGPVTPAALTSTFDLNSPSMTNLVVFATAAGYLAAGLWCSWYINRLGPLRVADGAPTGIGWRAAPRIAYLAAIGGFVAVILAEIAVQRLFPPAAAAKNPIDQIFGAAPWKITILFLVAAVVAPFVEELVFRGGMIAALAPRFGALGAAAVTTVIFTLCHAQETWSYRPALLVILLVAVLLAWLRLKYQSIRPGILLHVMFNGIGVLALAFQH